VYQSKLDSQSRLQLLLPSLSDLAEASLAWLLVLLLPLEWGRGSRIFPLNSAA